MAIPLVLILILVAKRSRHVKIVSDKAGAYLFWNGSIRFLMEGYLDFCLFAMMNAVAMDWSEQFLIVTICNYVTIFMLGIIIGFPVFASFFFLFHITLWDDEKFQERYGELLAGVNLGKKDAKWALIILPLIFFLRRLGLAYVLVFH